MKGGSYMRLIVTGKGMEISKYLEGLVEKKASKLERYFRPETDVYVTLSIEKSRHIAEVTVPFDGVVLRTEEVSGDMYGSIDAALKKLERQIRRHRTKLEKRLHDGAFAQEPVYEMEDMEHAVLTRDTSGLYLNYTKDVMDIMTYLRKEWNMKYPDENWD